MTGIATGELATYKKYVHARKGLYRAACMALRRWKGRFSTDDRSNLLDCSLPTRNQLYRLVEAESDDGPYRFEIAINRRSSHPRHRRIRKSRSRLVRESCRR